MVFHDCFEGNLIEERDGASGFEDLLRYHVHGSQYLDERVATYETGFGGGTAGWQYYLANDNYSVVGTANADGSEITRRDYTAGGGFPGVTCIIADSNCDGQVNPFDIDPFLVALTDRAAWEAAYPGFDYLCINDVNDDGQVNPFDIDPFVACISGGGCRIPSMCSCARPHRSLSLFPAELGLPGCLVGRVLIP